MTGKVSFICKYIINVQGYQPKKKEDMRTIKQKTVQVKDSQLVYQDSAKLHPGEIQSKGNFIVRILETREIIQIESYNPNDPQNPNE